MSDDAVISRTQMSEKQQKIKSNFEEREREDAKRQAQEDKRRKRLVRHCSKKNCDAYCNVSKDNSIFNNYYYHV